MAKKDIFCEWCKQEIKKGQKAAGMHTYNDFPKVSDERYFHFDCFLDWRDNSIKEAAMKVFNKSMKQVMPMIKPMANNIAENIKNSINNEETNKVYQVGPSQ